MFSNGLWDHAEKTLGKDYPERFRSTRAAFSFPSNKAASNGYGGQHSWRTAGDNQTAAHAGGRVGSHFTRAPSEREIQWGSPTQPRMSPYSNARNYLRGNSGFGVSHMGGRYHGPGGDRFDGM
jgi:hypothetical protein